MRYVHLLSAAVFVALFGAMAVQNADAEEKAGSPKLAPHAFVKKDAAQQFACPEEKVVVTEQPADKTKGKKTAYEASGCGKTARYLVHAVGATANGAPKCKCVRHCPVGPGSPGGGTTCCEWDCD